MGLIKNIIIAVVLLHNTMSERTRWGQEKVYIYTAQRVKEHDEAKGNLVLLYNTVSERTR